ncbi:hypothetical protein QTP88_015512 [Uroleucon formosanum]
MTKRKKKSPIPSSKRGPQRSQAKSPTPSSVTMNSEDSWPISPTSTSRSPTPDLPQNKANKTAANKIKTSRIPPIFVQTGAIYPWRKIAKTLFTIQGLDQVTAKTTSVPLQIQINCPEESSFRLVQQFMTPNKINFHTFALPEEQSIKIVIKGVPLDVTDEELMDELQEIGFKPNFVRAFAKKDKRLPIHMVSLKRTENVKEIFETTELFYVRVKIESYKSTGPAQCFSCQRFGHSSLQCGHPPRCVKCGENHHSKECKKPKEESPTCCNCNELWQIKMDRVKTPEEIDNKIDKLTTIIRNAQENASYTLKPKQIISQLPDEIILEITTKRQLRKMWQSSRDPRTKRLYNAKRTYVKNLLNEHRQTQWNAFTETLKFKNKSLYQLNRRILKKKAADTPLQTTTGHKIFEADEKAELFADTMKNQFIGNAGIDLQEVNETITEINLDQTTSNTYINPKEVLDIINKLPNGKSPGYDNISNTALKNLPHNIITQIAHIFTACLRISYFPKIWKKATIVMIPKPGKNHSISENHRPISLLSTISKVYEKIILKTLRIYIKPRAEQHAFREGHSTTTPLFHLFKEIKNNQKQKKYTAATFLDMEKAFDRVWHDGLIFKLKTNTRLPINMIKLIKSFLSDRSFQVRVVDQQSTTRQIQAGVPQGSCLSPLLYIQYVNDLPLLDKIQTSIFADDTMFHTAHKNRNYAICQLQRQLDQTVIWIDRWRLKLNIDKTEAIIFGSRQNKHLRQIKIKNQTIKWKNQIKYLGITMDSKLTMNGHTKTTTQKAKGVRASLYPILNQKSPIPLRTRIQMYTIYIKPILLYASVAWAPQLSQSNWRELEAVQNIALRTITGAYYLTTNEEIRQSADVRSISETIQYAKAVFLYRASISRFSHIRALTQ